MCMCTNGEENVHLLCFCRRNESIIGPRAFLTKQIGAMTVTGDDPKKFAAAVAEYSKKVCKLSASFHRWLPFVDWVFQHKHV